MLSSKRILGLNIQRYMNDMGIERQDLARRLGVPYNTLTNWINGVRYPRIDKIDALAEFFGVDKSDLVENPNNKKTGVRVPVLGYVAAGIPIDRIESVLDFEELDPDQFDPSFDYFGLKIHGDSMSPKIEDGDIVIVRKQPDAESGQLVIAAINGDLATCKKLIKTDTGIGLISFNQAYDPMFFTNADVKGLPVTIIGVVVELRARFI